MQNNKFKVGDQVVHVPNGENNWTEKILRELGNVVHTITHIDTNGIGTPLIHTDLLPMGAFMERFTNAQPYLNELKLKKLLGVEDEKN